MTRSRTILATAASIAVVGFLALPTASMADDLTLYTWSTIDSDPAVGGFSTTSPVDASLALLGADTLSTSEGTSGVEVCGGVGYATRGGFDFEGAPSVSTFDISTGALVTGPTPVTMGGAEIDVVREADTLADCTLLALVSGQVEEDGFSTIARIDPATGAATALVALTDELGIESYTGIATSPAGVTYLFATIDGHPQYAIVNLAADTYSAYTELAGLGSFYESEGFTLGVDFDAAGGFWVVNGVDREELYHLSSFAAGADLATAEPTDVGVLPYYGDDQLISWPIPLATSGLPVISPAAPQLADTGTELPLDALVVGGLLIVAGVAVGVVSRRRRAA